MDIRTLDFYSNECEHLTKWTGLISNATRSGNEKIIDCFVLIEMISANLYRHQNKAIDQNRERMLKVFQ